MELKAYVESVNKVFPSMREAEIIKAFNTAQYQFLQETELLINDGELQDIDSNTAWQLPDNFLDLLRIDFYDSNGLALYKENLNLSWDVEYKNLYFKSSIGDSLDGALPSTIDKVKIKFSQKPEQLTSLGSEFSVEIEWRPYILNKVLENLYQTTPVTMTDRGGNSFQGINSNQVGTNRGLYEAGVRKAIKKVKQGDDSTQCDQAINYDFAGAFVMPKREDSDLPIVIVPSNKIITKVYSKFVEFTATHPSTLTESSGAFGFTGTFSGVFASISGGDTLTITSTENDFDDGVTQITITNGDANWQINSPTEIQFTFWDTWSEITFEVWER